MSFRISWLSLGLLLLACDRSSAGPAARLEVLPPGTLATVGDLRVDAAMVAAIASRTGSAPRSARDAAIEDALFAAGMRADDGEAAARAEVSVLARELLHALASEAARTPIDDAELDRWTAERFVEFDRPPGYRIVHAVVLEKANAPAARLRAAREHAEALRAAVEPVVRAAATLPAPSRKPEEEFVERQGLPEDPITTRFRKAFSEIDHGSFDARFESLGVIAADGRYIDLGRSPEDRLLDAFARAASNLVARGDVSPVVETELEVDGKALRGHHVIALLGTTPEKRTEPSARRRALTPEILQYRAFAARRTLVERLRGEGNVAIARNASALLELIPHGGEDRERDDDARD